jgi:sugar phosphate isomerase/epimerase
MKRAIGLEHLTLLHMPPPELVTVAAAAGFDTVGLRVAPVTPNEDTWPVYPGSPMLAETRRRCTDTGVSVHSVEAIALGPGSVLAGQERVIETAAVLGARYLNVICDDPDTGRFTELLAELVATAREAGVRPVIEFTAYRPISRLADAIAVAVQTGGGILLDTLHIQRCGASVADIAAVDRGLLTYLQVCDAPLQQPHGLRGQHEAADDDRVLEARTMRLMPGEGQLPLKALLACLPADMLVSVEAPSEAALAAVSPGDYAARARHAVRLLAG